MSLLGAPGVWRLSAGPRCVKSICLSGFQVSARIPGLSVDIRKIRFDSSAHVLLRYYSFNSTVDRDRRRSSTLSSSATSTDRVWLPLSILFAADEYNFGASRRWMLRIISQELVSRTSLTNTPSLQILYRSGWSR